MNNYLDSLKLKLMTTFKLSYSLLNFDAELSDVIYDIPLLSQENQKKVIAKVIYLYIDIISHDDKDRFDRLPCLLDFLIVIAPDMLGIDELDKDNKNFVKSFSESERSCFLECLNLLLKEVPSFNSEIKKAVEYWTDNTDLGK